ncbi:MAG: hypothetical protein HJJLKODD_01110 [Phycisphaerae bacterium]|nr:hypothetical protein [Phycisphaerae bacterium]
MNILPGKTITITIVKEPRTENAKQTLGRVFLKDPKVRKARNDDPKPVTWSRRAGRYWHEQPSGSVLLYPKKGESAKVRATVDVIRDLGSVERYIEVR